MLRLLMIADDFTGALDTGVQLAAHGIPTQVVVGQADLSACSSTVLVVDTETRHLSAAKAAEAVARLTRSAVENGVGCIYKKTDSALRGNIGAELAALLKASGARNLPFLPAFPHKKGRPLHRRCAGERKPLRHRPLRTGALRRGDKADPFADRHARTEPAPR